MQNGILFVAGTAVCRSIPMHTHSIAYLARAQRAHGEHKCEHSLPVLLPTKL